MRAYLKIHSRHLHPLICGIFLPNSVNVARYASFIWQKSPTNCRIHLSESNFQTHSRNRAVAWHGLQAAAVKRKGRSYRWKDRHYQFWLRIRQTCSAMCPAYSAGEGII
ncbi:DUF6783 domain-containing protein [Lachnospiraceae bacterium JLR.KK009]